MTGAAGWQPFPDLHYTAAGSGGVLELFVQQGGAATGDSFDLDAVSLTEDPNLLANGSFELDLAG